MDIIIKTKYHRTYSGKIIYFVEFGDGYEVAYSWPEAKRAAIRLCKKYKVSAFKYVRETRFQVGRIQGS